MSIPQHKGDLILPSQLVHFEHSYVAIGELYFKKGNL